MAWSMRESSFKTPEKSYRIAFGNGRWATGHDAFDDEASGYSGPFSCATLRVAQQTCNRICLYHERAGLSMPKLTIQLQRNPRLYWCTEDEGVWEFVEAWEFPL